jgi:hypothetical protein
MTVQVPAAIVEAVAAGYPPAEAISLAQVGVSQLITSRPALLYGWSVGNEAAAAALTEVTPANPAPGASFTFTNAGTGSLQLTSAAFTLTASAAVANRFMQVQLQDAAGNDLVPITNGAATTAGVTTQMWLAQGLGYGPSGAAQAVGGLPSVALPTGYKVVLTAAGIQAADQISAITLTFQEQVSDYEFVHIIDGIDDSGQHVVRRYLQPQEGAESLGGSPGILCRHGIYVHAGGAGISAIVYIAQL